MHNQTWIEDRSVEMYTVPWFHNATNLVAFNARRLISPWCRENWIRCWFAIHVRKQSHKHTHTCIQPSTFDKKRSFSYRAKPHQSSISKFLNVVNGRKPDDPKARKGVSVSFCRHDECSDVCEPVYGFGRLPRIRQAMTGKWWMPVFRLIIHPCVPLNARMCMDVGVCVCVCVNLALYKDMCMAFLSCLFIVFCLLTTIVTVPVSLCICTCMHVWVCVWECVCLCCIYSCFLISFTVGCSYVLRPVEVFCGFAMYKCTFVSAHVSVCVCPLL